LGGVNSQNVKNDDSMMMCQSKSQEDDISMPYHCRCVYRT